MRKPVESAPLALVLLCYFFSALGYSALCGVLGRQYHPLAAFQVYALALTPLLAVALVVGRLTRLWSWRRAWPPTAPETRAALSSTVILTVSTLMYLSPQSLVAILVAQAGCLLLVARLSKPQSLLLVALSVGAVVLSVLHKPPLVLGIPLALGLAKMAGYWLKIRSVERAKAGEGAEVARSGLHSSEGAPVAVGQGLASSASAPRIVSPDDFLAAEQVLVSLTALGVATVASHSVAPAALADWRLWAVAAASLGMGLLGTRIMLRAEPMSVTFPAYRMASLLAAFAASVSRGELTWRWSMWPSWAAILLACVVLLTATGGLRSVRGWLRAMGAAGDRLTSATARNI